MIKEVLAIMKTLAIQDYEFLLIALTKESSDMHLREQCLSIIMGDEAATKKAIGLLLPERGAVGRRNDLLIENIRIIENFKLKEAAQNLLNLTKKSFFWNKGVRDAASKVLEKWGYGKD